MRTSSPVQRLIAALAVALLVAQSAWAVDQPAEASRVRFLIVVDTDDGAGTTWALDGRTLKAVLAAGLNKQKLQDRYEIETFSGLSVKPGHVLKYYHDLKLEADEALVFYYSGHGATHTSKGHFLQFTHGPLFRKELLAAMRQHNPRLVCVLTDCCADYAGNPPPPMGPAVINLDGEADIPDNPLPRRPAFKPGVKGPVPPPAGTGPGASAPAGSGVVLRTGDGPLPLRTIVNKTDGAILRDLFYRHTGLVDINGCQKGKSSHGTIPWGGSLFTIGLLSLQKEPARRFDTNRNGLVEWSEFFPHLQTSCERAGKSVGVHQVPEAVQLGQPVLVKQ